MSSYTDDGASKVTGASMFVSHRNASCWQEMANTLQLDRFQWRSPDYQRRIYRLVELFPLFPLSNGARIHGILSPVECGYLAPQWASVYLAPQWASVLSRH